MNTFSHSPTHGPKTPDVFPGKPGFRVFRCIGQYPTAKAALIKHFKFSPQEAESILQSAERDIPACFFFRLEEYIKTTVFAVAFKKPGQWFALEGDEQVFFESFEEAGAFIRRASDLTRLLGIAPSDYVIMDVQPPVSGSRLH